VPAQNNSQTQIQSKRQETRPNERKQKQTCSVKPAGFSC